MMILWQFSFNLKLVNAEENGYSIQNVLHKVEVMYTGYIIINDTVKLNGQAPNSLLIGFPYKYGPHVLKSVAYDEHEIFPVTLDVPLENRSGFYSVNVSIPKKSSQVFSVIFILSNDLLNQSGTEFFLDFPVYPSLTMDVPICDVSIILPREAQNIRVNKEDGIVYSPSFRKENLNAFSYSPANTIFSLNDSKIQIIDIKKLDRIIKINGIGEIKCSDNYLIINNSTNNINFLEITLPPNASDPIGQDLFGRTLDVKPILDGKNMNKYNITFVLPLKKAESTQLTVDYNLPNVTPEHANKFLFNFSIFPYPEYYVKQTTITIFFPEGAKILEQENKIVNGTYSLARNVFQETLTIYREDITYTESRILSENFFEIAYEYNPLWMSFRPTLWIWTLGIVGFSVITVWKRPKAQLITKVISPKLQLGLRSDYIQSFIDSYEDKKKIVLELRTLRIKAKKGKISRRRYKVRRKTLETRLNTLSRNILKDKELIRKTGGQYADLMRQLEIMETEINDVEINNKSIESRHSRGEISFEAYRKLLAEYQQRKEKAETKVNGILLRLREKIH